MMVQSARAVEYTDYNSAQGWDPHQWVSRCDTKQSDGDAPVILEFWWTWSNPSLPSLQGSP